MNIPSSSSLLPVRAPNRLTNRPTPVRPLRPALSEWAKETEIWRCHSPAFGGKTFNPLGPPRAGGRFRPILTPTGQVIPTLYGANGLEGALAETLLRDVPLKGSARHLMEAKLRGTRYSVVWPTRTLQLAVLYDPEVGRLGVRAADIGGSLPRDYPWTAEWAQSIHDDEPRADGLIWVPRNHNRALALMLFGDRVAEYDLDVVVDSEPLDTGWGRDEVLRLLEAADVALITD